MSLRSKTNSVFYSVMKGVILGSVSVNSGSGDRPGPLRRASLSAGVLAGGISTPQCGIPAPRGSTLDQAADATPKGQRLPSELSTSFRTERP
jgi:hypothetical protein